MLVRFFVIIFTSWILYNLLAMHINEVAASYGDTCTQIDSSNCTKPTLLCSTSSTCDCSHGYIKDNITGHDTICRIPVFKEKCDVKVGCMDSQQCSNVSGTMMCDCFRVTQYFDPSVGRCSQKPTSKESCDVSIGCVDFFECVGTAGSATCQCNSTDVYLDDINSMCLPVSDLAVDILSTEVTATTVTFKWDEDSPESGVNYHMQWIPTDGRVSYTYADGGQVSGLQPGSQYTFNIVSILIKELGSPEKRYVGPNITVCTKALYGGQCGVCGTCQDNNQTCVEAVDKMTRCLCVDNYFNASQTGNCTSLNNLTVTNVKITSTPTIIYLTWLTNVHLSSITYSVSWYPGDGHLDRVNSTGAQISGLSQGNIYYLSVNSVAPASAYDSEKIATSPEFNVWTKVPYLGACAPFTNAECDDTTKCILANDFNYHCLCDSMFYFNDTTGACSSINDLKVSQVFTIITATTITFTWPAKKLSAPLNFTVEWTPKAGRLDNVNNTSAHISGLTSGTMYNFTITSKLLSGKYYPEKSVSFQISSVRTKPAFNESCDVTIGCQDYQHCINISGSSRCQCGSSAEYYDNRSDRCLSKPNLNEKCDVNIGCEDFYQCVVSTSTCQCNRSDIYFDSIDYQCLLMSNLQVSLTSTIVSATTATFTWLENALDDTDVQYNIQWLPSGGKLDYVNLSGGQVSGLQPGKQYNFTMVSIIPGDAYYPEKFYFGPNVTLCTQVMYGGLCGVCNDCQDNTSNCAAAKDQKYRCLCGNSFYNTTQTGNCSSLSDLAVTDISSTSSPTAVNLTWTPSPSVTSATYRIKWYPKDGYVGGVTRTGSQALGLSPGVSYFFSVETVLRSDEYDNEKNVTSPEYMTKTQLSYLSDCLPYTNENCQDMTSCNLATDGRFLCMCNNITYFNNKLDKCSKLDELKVSNVTTTVTPTTVSFTWTTNQHQSLISYNLEWTPHDGKLDYINSTGSRVYDLNDGTMYSFTVISQLPGDHYYPEKRVPFQVSSVKTSPLNSSDNDLGLGLGIAIGGLLLITIVIGSAVLYKRRPQTLTRLLETSEYGSDDAHDGVHDGARAANPPAKMSSVAPENDTATTENISLENLSTVHK